MLLIVIKLFAVHIFKKVVFLLVLHVLSLMIRRIVCIS